MKRRWINFTSVFFTAATGLACLALTMMVALILGNVVRHGIGHISWAFLSQAPKSGMTEGGIFPAIFGTAVLVLLMTLAAVPLGVSTAIYLQEYAPKGSRWIQVVRLAIQNLAGVPAIVFGLFGLGFFIQFVGRGLDTFFFAGPFIWDNRPFFGRRSHWRF
jgi:phosphate transport system permease protein